MTWVPGLMMKCRHSEEGLGVVEKQENWDTDLEEGLGENSRVKERSSEGE